jgi:MarR family transcriptional regulator for hemolysin
MLCPLRENLRRSFDSRLTAFGVSRSLARPLMRIWQNDGIRQNELAQQLDIEGPSLVRLLDQLAESGLVVRRLDPSDQRAKTLHLTVSGKSLARRILPVVEGLKAELLADSSDKDLDTCLRVFTAFLTACDREATDAGR